MKWVLRVLLAVVALIAGLWLFGPREPVDVNASFDPRKFGEGIDVYLESTESLYKDIKPDQQKQIIWAGPRETRTPLSIVYLHGFSASSAEIRPVPDNVAKMLGANLVYTRFTGHGRTDPDAMAEATVHAWMQDVAEALALGRATGTKVIVIAASTGGTLMAEAALQPELVKDVAGIVFISPNFGLSTPGASLLTWSAARLWVPWIAGPRRSYPPRSEAQAEGWTTNYPTVATLPLAALVKHAVAQDYTSVKIPALFYFSDHDQVVRPDITHEIVDEWGGPKTVVAPDLKPGDDQYAHVIAGDILSPGNTQAAAELIAEWVFSVLK